MKFVLRRCDCRPDCPTIVVEIEDEIGVVSSAAFCSPDQETLVDEWNSQGLELSMDAMGGVCLN